MVGMMAALRVGWSAAQKVETRVEMTVYQMAEKLVAGWAVLMVERMVAMSDA